MGQCEAWVWCCPWGSVSVFGAATTSGRFEGRTARRLSTWTRDYLLKHCVDALDQCPHVVLAHSSTALIDTSGTVTQDVGYNLATASPSAPERFRSLLYEVGGDDDGGVIRMDVLRRAPLLGSYQHSDRTLTAGIALYGSFYQVPDWLYFRRDHAERAERAFKTVQAWCANLDPPVRRAAQSGDPPVRRIHLGLRHRDPAGSSDASRETECYRHLAGWLVSRASIRRGRYVPEQPSATGVSISSIDASVPRRERKVP